MNELFKIFREEFTKYIASVNEIKCNDNAMMRMTIMVEVDNDHFIFSQSLWIYDIFN